jgi:hypothetical protein
MRAKGAIDLTLNGPNREEVVSVAHDPIVAEASIHGLIGLPAHCHMQADGEFSCFSHRPQPIDLSKAGALVMERGDPMPEGIFARKLYLTAEALSASLIRHSLFKALERCPGRELRRLPKEARWVSFAVADNEAPFWVRGVGIDASRLEGQSIRETPMSAGMREEDRVGRANLTQAMVRGDPVVCLGRGRIPTLLVPSATRDPHTGLCSGSGLSHNRNDLLPGGGPREIQDHPRLPKP